MRKIFNLFLCIILTAGCLGSTVSANVTETIKNESFTTEKKFTLSDLDKLDTMLLSVYDIDKVKNDLRKGKTVSVLLNSDSDFASLNGISRTRGNCTDVATKEWCDTHGYENNRPVGASVQLTPAEVACYLSGMGTLFNLAATIVTDGSYIVLFTDSVVSFYHYCISNQ